MVWDTVGFRGMAIMRFMAMSFSAAECSEKGGCMQSWLWGQYMSTEAKHRLVSPTKPNTADAVKHFIINESFELLFMVVIKLVHKSCLSLASFFGSNRRGQAIPDDINISPG